MFPKLKIKGFFKTRKGFTCEIWAKNCYNLCGISGFSHFPANAFYLGHEKIAKIRCSIYNKKKMRRIYAK